MNITVKIPDGVVESVAQAIRGNQPAPPPMASAPLAEGEAAPEPPPEPTPQQIVEEFLRNDIAALYQSYEGQRAAEKARQKAEKSARKAMDEA